MDFAALSDEVLYSISMESLEAPLNEYFILLSQASEYFPLANNASQQEVKNWFNTAVTQMGVGGEFTCREILYPYTKACCEGYYCPAR